MHSATALNAKGTHTLKYHWAHWEMMLRLHKELFSLFFSEGNFKLPKVCFYKKLMGLAFRKCRTPTIKGTMNTHEASNQPTNMNTQRVYESRIEAWWLSSCNSLMSSINRSDQFHLGKTDNYNGDTVNAKAIEHNPIKSRQTRHIHMIVIHILFIYIYTNP